MLARRTLFALLIAALTLGCAPAQMHIDGRWTGEVVAGGETTRLILDFTRRGDVLEGRMSLPDQRLLGKRLKQARLAGNALSFVIPAHQGDLRFGGVLDGATITGAALDQRTTIPITLHRIGDTPAPPYREIPINFRSTGGLTLSGSLLLPQGEGPFPAMVLSHGSSTPDRNDYRYYADLYARAGIAALIYDKRDTGPEADGGRVPLETLADDLEAAAGALRMRPDIDAGRIGIWGFSQGGWLAPMVAARGDYACVVVLSGPGVTYAVLNRYADGRRLQRERSRPETIAEADRLLARVDQYARDRRDGAELQAELARVQTQGWAQRTTLPRILPGQGELRSQLRWIDLDLDPATFWRRVHAPALLMFGAEDNVVPVEQSVARITGALRAGGNRDVTAITYPGANHELAPTPSLDNDMVNWTLARLRAPRGASPARRVENSPE